jgi:hypothetical protein
VCPDLCRENCNYEEEFVYWRGLTATCAYRNNPDPGDCNYGFTNSEISLNQTLTWNESGWRGHAYSTESISYYQNALINFIPTNNSTSKIIGLATTPLDGGGENSNFEFYIELKDDGTFGYVMQNSPYVELGYYNGGNKLSITINKSGFVEFRNITTGLNEIVDYEHTNKCLLVDISLFYDTENSNENKFSFVDIHKCGVSPSNYFEYDSEIGLMLGDENYFLHNSKVIENAILNLEPNTVLNLEELIDEDEISSSDII